MQADQGVVMQNSRQISSLMAEKVMGSNSAPGFEAAQCFGQREGESSHLCLLWDVLGLGKSPCWRLCGL